MLENRIMKTIKSYIVIICFLLVGLTNVSYAKANKVGIKAIEIQCDDPIAAMLDSLQTLKLFECSSYTTDTCVLNTYNYCPDLIPHFDDLTIEERLNKLDNKSPFDLVFNESVKNYIEMYANRKRTVVSKVLGLSHLYFNMFEEQLDKYNLPLELKYLAIVESALNPTAISRTGAAGLWQFMLPTGKMFGLDVTSYVDERKDPYQSTLAACKYLKYLYNLFGDWQMVLAAYNSGPGTVSKAIRRSGGKTTYWEIRPFLPTETQNYVPAFIAVNYVMNYSREHNLYPITVKSNYFFADTVHVKQQVTLNQIATIIDMPLDEIHFLNPAYKLGIVPKNEEASMLCLPSNKVGTFLKNEVSIYNFKTISTTTKFISKQINAPEKIKHKVKANETITTIAALYGVNAEDLKKWNKINKNSVAKGRLLTILKNKQEPDVVANNVSKAKSNKASYTKKPFDKTQTILSDEETKQLNLEFSDNNNFADADTSIVSKNNSKQLETAKAEFIIHTVHKGDTLWNIANRYKGSTVEEIVRINKLSAKKALKVGEKIKVPIS